MEVRSGTPMANLPADLPDSDSDRMPQHSPPPPGTPHSPPFYGLRLGWPVFLATSWTWCIGMFLPVLMVRDYGIRGFLVFALPNMIGAAAMGTVLKSPGHSRRMVESHGVAGSAFSTVTILFHGYFIAWVVRGLIGPIGIWITLGLALLMLVPAGVDRSARRLAICVFLFSLLAFAAAAGRAPRARPPVAFGNAQPALDLLGLAAACGVWLCLLPLSRSHLSPRPREDNLAPRGGGGVRTWVWRSLSADDPLYALVRAEPVARALVHAFTPACVVDRRSPDGADGADRFISHTCGCIDFTHDRGNRGNHLGILQHGSSRRGGSRFTSFESCGNLWGDNLPALHVLLRLAVSCVCLDLHDAPVWRASYPFSAPSHYFCNDPGDCGSPFLARVFCEPHASAAARGRDSAGVGFHRAARARWQACPAHLAAGLQLGCRNRSLSMPLKRRVFHGCLPRLRQKRHHHQHEKPERDRDDSGLRERRDCALWSSP